MNDARGVLFCLIVPTLNRREQVEMLLDSIAAEGADLFQDCHGVTTYERMRGKRQAELNIGRDGEGREAACLPWPEQARLCGILRRPVSIGYLCFTSSSPPPFARFR